MSEQEKKDLLAEAATWFEDNYINYPHRDAMYSAFMKKKGLTRMRGEVQQNIHILADQIFVYN